MRVCAQMLSLVRLFVTLWTIGRLLCPWDSPGKNTGGGCMPSSRGSSWPRDQTHVSGIGRRILYQQRCLGSLIRVRISYPLGGFPSHLGHRRALSRVPCAMQSVLISYHSIRSVNSVYVAIPIPQFISPALSSWHPYICSPRLCLFLLYKYSHLYSLANTPKMLTEHSSEHASCKHISTRVLAVKDWSFYLYPSLSFWNISS